MAPSDSSDPTELPRSSGPKSRELEVTADSTSADSTVHDDRPEPVPSFFTPGGVPGLAGTPALPHGAASGRYKVLSILGEGGFGIVYLAEQSEPVRRKVALKVLKLGAATPSMLARFSAEQQALAMMDHPGLAKVFDAGVTPDGQPYFAMEFVPGEPLASYCDKHRIDIRGRLNLLALVCDAVQHAHMKGLVHRDLKPGNILVSEVDQEIRPKVIDFGIAKTISAGANQNAQETQFGHFVGTPVYMSPEQAEGGATDIDIRSDLYSIGVMLYELLVGKTPIDAETLRASGIAFLHRVLIETEPLRPSERLSKLSPQERAEITSLRKTDYKSLYKHLHRDLDWITMRCLEKDRNRRYDSASGLAADIRRYLNGEPVLAGPPGKSYKIRKFVRRHRVGVGAAVLALAGIIVFGTSMLFLWRDALRQQQRAQATLDVFVKSLKAGDVTTGDSTATVTVAELLRLIEKNAMESMQDQEDILNELRETIGPVLTSLIDFESAGRVLKPAVEFRRKQAQGGDKEAQLALANALHEYARTEYLRADYPAALATYSEALALRKQWLAANDSKISDTLRHISSTHLKMGNTELSDQASAEAFKVIRAADDPAGELLATALFARAKVLRAARRDADSRKLVNECIEVLTRHKRTTDWRMGYALALLAEMEFAESDFDLATTHLASSIALLEPKVGSVHNSIVKSRHELARYHFAVATGQIDPPVGTVVKDRSALLEAIRQVRIAIDGRRQMGAPPTEIADSLALFSRLNEANADSATALAAERQIIALLLERAPHETARIKRAKDRVAQMENPIPISGADSAKP